MQHDSRAFSKKCFIESILIMFMVAVLFVCVGLVVAYAFKRIPNNTKNIEDLLIFSRICFALEAVPMIMLAMLARRKD